MKRISFLAHFTACAVTTVSLVLFAACDNKTASSSGQDAGESSAKAAPPEAPDPNLPEKKVEITGNDQMKFDVVAIEAKPGQKVTVTLKNLGTMPKVSMGHNFVLLKPGIDPAKFVEAGQMHMARDFIAPEMESQVIAHTKLLGPGETDTISFAAPRKPGAYTYICSFPGHFAIGMKGVLTVQ
ncbi:MAG TPA: azurin [Chthoniobacteraceae bacterium]|nr:azurin [Chthoniobacteraceae bacterium]